MVWGINMDYRNLAESANTSIQKLQEFIESNGSSDTLESIKQQMTFIRDNALEDKDPSLELNSSQKFTYAILSAREFSSPQELELKEYINKVSRILDGK